MQKKVSESLASNRYYQDGVQEGKEQAVIAWTAAISIAAHDKFGFGAIRCERLLKEAERVVLETLNVNDLLREARGKTRLQMRIFNEDGSGLPDLEDDLL